MGSTYSRGALRRGPVPDWKRAVEAAFDEVRRLDQMLSNYRPDSEWSEVNRHAAERPVKVSAELFHLLVGLRASTAGRARARSISRSAR